LAGMLKEAAVA